MKLLSNPNPSSRSMYWVLERRAPDESWQAVVSNLSLFRGPSGGGFFAGCAISANDPAFFAVISGIETSARGRINPDIEPYAHSGLPQDASRYAIDLLAHPIRTGGALRRAALTKPGHIRLVDLQRDAAQGRDDIVPEETLSGNAPAEDYLLRLWRRLEIILGQRPSSITPDLAPLNLADREILFGVVTEGFDGTLQHNDMDAMSHHTEIEMVRQLTQLAPCTPENLRLLFAYGF